MAIALAAIEAPFDLLRAEKVFAAVRGDDEVEVGPDLYTVHYDELIAQRPQAARHIRWQPVPRLEPITAEQRVRVAHVLATGKPPPPPDRPGD